jgi:hypothetical protein
MKLSTYLFLVGLSQSKDINDQMFNEFKNRFNNRTLDLINKQKDIDTIPFKDF